MADKIRVFAAERRRADLLARAEKKRHELATRIDNSPEFLGRARAFVREYNGTTAERAESQTFWNDFFAIFGLGRRVTGVEFERQARRSDTGGPGRIDVFWSGVLLAEHKSQGGDFVAALAQADSYEIPEAEKPRLTVVCDFARFFVRDNGTGRSVEFALGDLPKHLGWFGPLVEDELVELSPQRPVDVKAAEKMAELHDELREVGYEGHNLRVLMTRLLFCFFADDAGIWPHGKFDRFLGGAPVEFAGAVLSQLFEVLNQPLDDRPSSLSEDLRSFPYVNGGLFAEQVRIPAFNEDLFATLLGASEEVDWSQVSPAVFGAMFQGVMDAGERHDLGAHYTSEENILKVIEPLFLDGLYREIDEAASVPVLERIWERMAAMTFLDPAAGCGNFLVVAYRELRRVERHLMAKLQEFAKNDKRHAKKYPWVYGHRQLGLEGDAASKLSVGQFYGIEIDEWPAQIAKVAMWLTDHLANMELEDQFGGQQTRLPLVDTAHITVGNALRVDWDEVMGGQQATFIFGNPPFLGSNMQSAEQKEDMKAIWGTGKGKGTLDYVTCWFKKTAEYIDGTNTRVAFVSTNSITQGEQPAVLWEPLYAKNIHIDFAHRSFKWTNEAKGKAGVHVVIIGFSQGVKSGKKTLWEYPTATSDWLLKEVDTINAYLVSTVEVSIKHRKTPFGDETQSLRLGSIPFDGGGLILSKDEKEEIFSSDPIASAYVRRLVGAAELIQGKERYCLWLVNAAPQDIRNSSTLSGRIEKVKNMRLSSKRPATRKLSSIPSLFGEIRQPTSSYLAVPSVSSEKRDYIPMAFMKPNVVATNLIFTIEGADLVTFGVLSSLVFTVWNATVSGRLKSDYRISAEITYNNFPWPDMDEAQREKVAAAAQKVLDARTAHEGSTLADLYDPLAMPKDLVKAHQGLDAVVLGLFGLKRSAVDADVLAVLFKRYGELVAAEEKAKEKVKNAKKS